MWVKARVSSSRIRASVPQAKWGFFLLPLLGILPPLLAIPILVRDAGAAGWAAIAVGQGLGGTASLIVLSGWGVTGPAEVARRNLKDQRHLYWVSFFMRVQVFAALAPIVAVLTGLIADEPYRTAAILTCLAGISQGLTPAWFLIGQSRPTMLIAMDAGPRVVGILVGTVSVSAFHRLALYGLVTLVTEVLIAITAQLALGRRQSTRAEAIREANAHFRYQWMLGLSALFSSGYTRLAVPLVAAVNPGATPTFAALDRIGLLSRGALSPFINSFQGHVASRPNHREMARAASAATRIVVTVGAIGGILIAALLPSVSPLLFTDAIAISRPSAFITGVAVIFVAGSYATSLFYLAPLGRAEVITRSTITASLLGIPVLIACARWWGSTGAISAVAASELVVVIWQCLEVRRRGNREQRRFPSPGGDQ